MSELSFHSQPLTGEHLSYHSANREDGARLGHTNKMFSFWFSGSFCSSAGGRVVIVMHKGE